MKLSISADRREGEEYFKNFDMTSYALENFSMFGGEIRRVHIEFPNDKVGIFIDRFGKDITIREAGQEYDSRGCSGKYAVLWMDFQFRE